MLVLSRKIGERIHIGDDITFVVLDVKSGRVRLGIEAPLEVTVLRAELGQPTEQRAGQEAASRGMHHAAGNP